MVDSVVVDVAVHHIRRLVDRLVVLVDVVLVLILVLHRHLCHLCRRQFLDFTITLF
jgi:hypothetical protein